MLRKIFRVLAFGLMGFALAGAAGAEMPSHPQGRVSDFASVLTQTAVAEITALAESVEKATGAQLAVVTVPSLDGESVEMYAVRLFKAWGIGQKGKDNGVLLLVAPNEHKVKIEVGYGLEGVINDGKAGRILHDDVVPYFKSGDYSQGVLRGSERLAAAITGDESHVTAAPPPPAEPPMDWKAKIGILLFFGLFVTLGFLALGAGFRGQGFFIIWGAGFGGIPLAMSFAFGYAFGFPVLILPVWALACLVVGLIFGKKLGTMAKSSGGSSSGGSSWSSGSSFSSGFGGGSSFSSFGGGSSGGGGASSSW